MVHVTGHGGGCCGRQHIFNFHYDDDNTIAQLRRLTADAQGLARVRGIILEIVLTNNQCNRLPRTLAAMKEIGYKLVYRGVNKNSGAMCNVFMYHPHASSIEHHLPASLQGFNEE